MKVKAVVLTVKLSAQFVKTGHDMLIMIVSSQHSFTVGFSWRLFNTGLSVILVYSA